MGYDFDRVYDRRGTDSLKYDLAEKLGMPEDILPLWVADMDFPSPPEVLEALKEKCAHGIFGYSDAMGSGYFDSLYNWYSSRCGWETDPEWLVKAPGVVFAVSAAMSALTAQGEGVIIQEPVYSPFARIVRAKSRRLSVSPLVLENGRYRMDLEDFERRAAAENVRAFILCSPHNPVGRVWTRRELEAVGEICLRHGIYVISDEIHSDFIRPGNAHRVFASISKELADITVTCTAPTKTFNLAALQISNIFISNPSLKERFEAEIDKTGYGLPNIMGITASRAAYEHGGAWLDALLSYLEGNFKFLENFLRNRLPKIRLVPPEGTYLAWLDCRELGLSPPELDRFITEKALLWLNGGTKFGSGGEGFQRLNIACPRSVLTAALLRLEAAAADL